MFYCGPRARAGTAWSSSFRILHYEDVEGQWDWCIRRARVLRVLAQKW